MLSFRSHIHIFIMIHLLKEWSKIHNYAVLTELKAIIPKALSLDRMVMVALFGVPSVTPLEELWKKRQSNSFF